MTVKLTLRRIAAVALITLPVKMFGQGVVTNIPPLPTLTPAEKQKFSAPDPDAAKNLQAIWQENQAKFSSLTNGPLEAIIAELGQPAIGTTILWQHMPEVSTQEINTFRSGWLVWWPPRFDTDFGIVAKEPEAASDRALKASLFEALLRRNETRAIEFLSGICMNNPPTLQHASYAKAVLEYQPRSNLFTKATAPFWGALLDSDNPLFLGMALQLTPGRVTQSDLEIALRRTVNSDWMSLKYLAVEAVASLPIGKERDELAHEIDPIRRTTSLPALITDRLQEMEAAQQSGPAYPPQGVGSADP